MYEIIDVSTWEITQERATGSKDKEWRIRPFDKKYGLFKKPVSLLEENRDPEKPHTGESWSEKIASEIGKQVGIRTHDVEIAYADGVYGSLCWRFLDPRIAELEEGADLIDPFDRTYDRNKLYGDVENYNMELLYKVFEENHILDYLFDMIAFDALIGNTDRHQDNFGIIKTIPTGDIEFAPLYDNASCLGRELLIGDVQEKLKNPDSFKSYLSRCTSLIRTGCKKRGTKHFVLVGNILQEPYKQSMLHSIQKVATLSDTSIEEVVSNVPSVVMPDVFKEFVIRVLVNRRNTLIAMG